MDPIRVLLRRVPSGDKTFSRFCDFENILYSQYFGVSFGFELVVGRRLGGVARG